MKRSIFLVLSLLFATSLFAQETEPPYKKHPFFPPVKLLMTDSTTWYTKADLPKKKQVMVMVFNPLCDHCIDMTEDLIKNREYLKDIHIVMATSFYFDSLRVFKEKYHLGEQKNIVVGYDPKFFLNTFYDLHNLPFLAFYNKEGKLISGFNGSLPVGRILQEFKLTD